jgi:5-carboxymethyl-2-hydroxymuconate isomerase
MPHITLEYTDNLTQKINSKVLFSRLHQILLHEGKINVDNCKSRAIRLDTYYVGSGEPQDAFVHLDVRFLEGRSTELKRRIGQLFLQWLEEYFEPSLARLPLQITVEVNSIDRSTYFKFPESSFIELT